MLVRIEDVGKTYALGIQVVTALKNVNLNIDEGAFLAIAGPSGSGKSTLLNLIGLIDIPTHGRILIDEREVSGRTPDAATRNARLLVRVLSGEVTPEQRPPPSGPPRRGRPRPR